MCGIFLETNSLLRKNELQSISLDLVHRGPDSQNIYIDNYMKISMAFARLAIQDLSFRADQPLFSDDNLSYILFNGEIYNKDKLKEMLPKNFTYKTNSDTELLLSCIVHIGLKVTLNQIEGMFAFIFVDISKKTISVVRDLFGIKPMYYMRNPNGSFKFSSEIKVLRKLLHLNIDKDMLREFAVCGLIDHTNNTMYSEIKKIAPGTIFTIGEDFCNEESWVIPSLQKLEFDSKSEALIDLSDFVRDSVQKSLISDVPVGITLSSGIDSNLIRTFVQEIKPETQLHSVGWGNDAYSETQDLQKYLNPKSLLTVHNFNSSQVYDSILESFGIHDEPYTSPFVAVWPKIFRSMRKQGISVVLDGTGADEIFFGYTKYLSNSFEGYAQRALDGTKVGLGFKSNYEYEPVSLRDARDYDLFKIKLPRSLRFLDSSSMSASIEARPVFLTKALYELSSKLSMDLLISNENTKYLLRWILNRENPTFPAFERKKSIQLPIAKWINQDWRQLIVREIKNIDNLLDLIPNQIERESLLIEANKFCNFDLKTNIQVIWRIFNLKLWLNSV